MNTVADSERCVDTQAALWLLAGLAGICRQLFDAELVVKYFQMFASRMSQPLLRLVGLWQEFQQASISVKRLGDILDMPQEPFTLTPQRAGGGEGRIDIRDIGFRYSEQHPWLYRGLTLAIPTGKLTVLMGPSGCGKSTLAKLMLGFY